MRNRRNTDPTVLLIITALLAAGGAVAAGVMHHRNQARLDRYRSDLMCGTDLSIEKAQAVTGSSACSIERASVASRWIHQYRSSKYYRLAIRSDDGALDSLELTGDRERGVWEGAVPNGLVFVERFTDPDPAAKRHVTVVRSGGIATRTEWNPERRDDQATIGVGFLGLLAASCGAGALVANRKRHRANRPTG